MSGKNYGKVIEALQVARRSYDSGSDVDIGFEAAINSVIVLELNSQNEYYGSINERYNDRAAKLVRLGFSYIVDSLETVPGVTMGAFVLRGKLGKPKIVSSGVVLYAEERAWYDIVKTCEEYANA